LSVALRLLARLDWHGGVLTGDALYCQTDPCASVRQAGGDYLVIVKENQPQLHRGIAIPFASRADPALCPASLLALGALADRAWPPLRRGCDAGRGSRFDPHRQRAEHHGDPARDRRQRAASGGRAIAARSRY
jgi:hypothetical protein